MISSKMNIQINIQYIEAHKDSTSLDYYKLNSIVDKLAKQASRALF